MRTRAAAAAILLVAGALTACSSGGTTEHLHLTVSPARALYDTAVGVRVTGLHSGQRATIEATSTAADGTGWSDSAQFTADAGGTVTTAQAPVSGSYSGANPMGIFEDLAPGGNPDVDGRFVPKSSAWTITVSVLVDGHTLAHQQITRLRPTEVGVTETTLRPASGGLYGDFFAPRSATAKHPAVLVFGGSEGGLSTDAQAALLAAHGYPALALAYFHETGLPSTLRNIPLEYFVKALHVLAGEPGVDPKRLLVWGESRGSEAALLVGAHYPSIVAGVIATSPSDIAFMGIPPTAPAWTFQGHGVPTASRYDFGQVDPVDAAKWRIDVAAINGPIFLACGKADGIWPSCGYASSVASILAAAHAPHRPTVLAYANAGHFVDSLLPYVPDTETQGRTAAGMTLIAGGEPSATDAARADGWPKLLAFLAALR